MDKLLIRCDDDLIKFRQEHPERHDIMWRSEIRKMLGGIESPKSYPALLVWNILDDSDDGLFIEWEWVYPSDFEGSE